MAEIVTGLGEPAERAAWVPVQRLPETRSDERQHILDDMCWCRPVTVPPSAGGPLLVHKRPADD